VYVGSESERTPSKVLLENAARGQRTALGQLILAYEPLVLSDVRRLLGPRLFAAHGEDVLQNVRLALVKGLPGLKVKNRTVLRAWIRKLVHRQVLDWAKARNAARRMPSRGLVRLDRSDAPKLAANTPTPSRLLLSKERRELLHKAIGVVPPRYRKVLRFISKQSPTLAELEEFTGKGREAVRKFVERALHHLEAALGRALRTRENPGR
jgi:RNA polymerase sigma factor (sigma-70 family)